MASQLHQAVELAQAGKREESRQLLWQFLQTEPNNEIAWLWLASVAADQPEYQHALNQVLRINPSNERAQQLLAQFQQQQQGAAASTMPPSASYGTGTPPPSPSYSATPPPEPVQGVPVPVQQQPQPQQYAPVYAAPPRPVEAPQQRRGGCLGCLPRAIGCGGCLGCGGCGQGCLLALVIFIVLPFLACGGLSYADVSLGPLDIPARYLPGEFGRKSVTVEIPNYDVTLKVPRSWYVASADNSQWSTMVDILDNVMPFQTSTESWTQFETSPNVTFVDTDPVILSQGGGVIGMVLSADPVQGDFACADVKAQQAEYDSVDTYGNNLCGYSLHRVDPASVNPVFKSVDPPADTRTIDFVVPVTATTATSWQITLPDGIYDQVKDQIDAMIQSVEVKQK